MANIIKESLPQLLSPNAAELGRYGKNPVNYFNGLPGIVVPLTSVHAKGYELPVSLSYHAGGNRPEQHPGWVGLGWSLRAGGCISRVINGMKDEMTSLEYGATTGISPGSDPGYLFHIGETKNSNWMDDEVLKGVYGSFKDHSPDEYLICAGDLNASFYIAGEKEISIVSKDESSFSLEDLTVSEDTDATGIDMYPGQCANPIRARRYKYISRFVIMDKEGNRYVFGGDDSAIEYSVVQHPNFAVLSDGAVINSNGWRAVATANTWLLSRIERVDGEVITFTYEKNGVPVVLRDIHHGELYYVNTNPALRGQYDTADPALRIKQNLNYLFLLPSYLKKINCRLSGDVVHFVTEDSTELPYLITESDFNLNVVNLHGIATAGPFEFGDFMRNNRYRKLTGINGKNRNIRLEYTDDATTRLKLLSVKFRRLDGDVDGHYEFVYDSTRLPGYNSRQTDLWGYYNGYDFSSSVGGFGHGLDALRGPDESKMKAEILVSMRYPAGGSTEYEYEAHRYSKEAKMYPFAVEACSVDGMAGGLRIKSITNHAVDGVSEARCFDYTEGGRSSGILSGQVKNFVSGSAPGYLGGATPVTIDFAMYSECPILPMSDTDGCHVTYGTVTEIFPDGGRSVRRYLNLDDSRGADSAPDNEYGVRTGCPLHPRFMSRALSRGLLLSRKDYREDGALVREETSSYLDACVDRMKSVTMEKYLNGCICFITYVRRPCGYPALASRTVTTYGDDGVGITDTWTYSHNARRLPVQSRHSRGGLSDVETVFYPGDREGGIYAAMLGVGMYGVPVGKARQREGKVISGEETEFRRIDVSMGRSTKAAYVPFRIYRARMLSPVDPSLYMASPLSYMDPVPDVTVHGYDICANPLSVGFRDGSAVEYHWTQDHTNPALSVRMRDYEVPDHVVTGRLDSVTGSAPEFSKCFRTTAPSTQVTCQVFANYGFDLLFAVDIDGASYCILGCCNPETPDARWQGYMDNYGVCVTVAIPAGEHTISIRYLDVRIGAMAQGDRHGHVGYTYYDESSLRRRSLLRDFEEELEPDTGFHSEHGHVGPFNARLVSDVNENVLDYMFLKSGVWSYRRQDYIQGTVSVIGESAGVIDNLRIFPYESQVESFTWYPSSLMRSRTDGRGVTESYSYDALGRLADVRDNGGNLISSNEYNYAEGSQTRSYVLRRVFTDYGGCAFIRRYRYHDGLGREVQDVLVDGGGSGWDIVTEKEYDNCGREFRKWLPAPVQYGVDRQSGAYATRPQIMAGGNHVYPISDARRYEESAYDASPLERITEKYGAGEAWYAAEKRMTSGLLSNVSDTASDLYCRGFSLDWSGNILSLRKASAASSGTLQVIRTEDEDGGVTLEFINSHQDKVMIRRVCGAERYDTHYVYDAFGRLAAMLPPALSERLEMSGASVWTESSISDLAFLYRYDSRGGCIAKLVPGAGWTYYVYDRGGRLLLSQDSVLRQCGRWRFFLSDIFGRVCLEGTAGLSVDIFSEPLANSTVFVSLPQFPDYASGLMGYEISGFSLGNSVDILNVRYYDGYCFLGGGLFPAVDTVYDASAEPEYTARYVPSASGLLTGVLTRIIDDSADVRHLWTVMYYDDKRRMVQRKSSTHLGGVDTEYRKYDFVGNVTGRKLRHRQASGAYLEEQYSYTYDAMGRPLETAHKVDGASWRTVSSLVYDRIGRVVSEKRNGSAALLSGSSYNIRSWLAGVSGPFFSETLRYQDGSSPQWGGRLSEMAWRSGTETFDRKYFFIYDGLSRLLSAIYGGDAVAEAFSESYAYDRNGNMTSLHRCGLNAQGTGKVTLLSISLSYDGNRLSAIGDSTFSYDDKGREIASSYGGSSTTSYNVLDLPLRQTLPGGVCIDYEYAADGAKLREKFSGTSTIVSRDYCGPLVYEGEVLQKILFDGGYVDMVGQSPSYHFFLRDHLGSVRVVAAEDGTVEQVNHYYPFGSLFSDPRTISGNSTNRQRFIGKELNMESGLYDFSARFLDPLLGRFTTVDPLAERYPDISPYVYCAGDPVNALDPDGRAWRPTRNKSQNTPNGYEWVDEKSSYDKDGNLFPGLSEYAIFFSDNGTFEKSKQYNMGSSMATVYLPDGTTRSFKACTYPADPELFATVPEGIYEAHFGKHHGQYDALKMRDVDAKNQTIELGTTNPAYKDGRTYAAGINIHMAGGRNLTGKDSQGRYVSKGCLLIDRDEWENFMELFDKAILKTSPASITVSRSLAFPVNTDED